MQFITIGDCIRNTFRRRIIRLHLLKKKVQKTLRIYFKM